MAKTTKPKGTAHPNVRTSPMTAAEKEARAAGVASVQAQVEANTAQLPTATRGAFARTRLRQAGTNLQRYAIGQQFASDKFPKPPPLGPGAGSGKGKTVTKPKAPPKTKPKPKPKPNEFPRKKQERGKSASTHDARAAYNQQQARKRAAAKKAADAKRIANQKHVTTGTGPLHGGV